LAILLSKALWAHQVSSQPLVGRGEALVVPQGEIFRASNPSSRNDQLTLRRSARLRVRRLILKAVDESRTPVSALDDNKPIERIAAGDYRAVGLSPPVRRHSWDSFQRPASGFGRRLAGTARAKRRPAQRPDSLSEHLRSPESTEWN
jgi:hypothetical protein